MADRMPIADDERGPGRQVFRNTLINGAASFFRVALSIALLPLIINHLGAATYGVWVLAAAFSLSGGFLSIADMGLQQSLAKFVAEADANGRVDRISSLMSSALAVFVTLAILVLSAITALAPMAASLFNVPAELASVLQVLLALFAMEAAIGLPSLVFVGLMEGLQRYGAIRAVEMTRQILYAALVVVLIRRGNGVLALGGAVVLTGALAALAMVVIGRRAVPGVRLSHRYISFATLRDLTNFGGWLFVSKVNGVVWRQMDKAIIAALLTTSLLAGYDVANRVQAAALVVMMVTASALIPAASRLGATGQRDALRSLLVRGTRYTMALSLPVVLGGMIMAPALIEQWVGPGFLDMVPATRLFLSYQLFVSAAVVGHTMLVGLGHVRTTTLYAAGATGLNVVLSLLLVRPFGVEGVIAATVLGYAITTPLHIRLALTVTGTSAKQFVRTTVLPLLPWAVLFVVVIELSRRLLDPSSLLAVVLVSMPAFVVYFAAVARYAISEEERRALVSYVAVGGRAP